MSYNYADISNYEFKKTIGEGNFAKVKLSIFKPTKEEFAIKIINKKKLQKKMKNTIFRENEIISQLKHPNIITVYEILEDSENYYIIMENCKNGELFDYIVAHQNLSENEASIFFYQLIKGVEYIHSKNIVHRDLKPENLLLTENNILKIIDFGLSHPFDGTEMLKTKCGSPSYASPEIITGTEYDGFKTDVWCCGVILYAMLCGFLPFEGENDMELFKNIVECDPEIPRELSKESKKLIRKIFTPNPKKRITIPEIKKTDFYLKGKELFNIKYGTKGFNRKIPPEKKLEFIKEFYNDLCEDDYSQKRNNNNNNEIEIVIDGEKNNIFEAIEEINDKDDDIVTIGSNEEEKEDALKYIKKNNINIFDINKIKHLKETHIKNIKENEITNKDSQENSNQVDNNGNEVKERGKYMQTYGKVETIKNPKMKLHINFNQNFKKNNIFNSFRKKLIKDNNIIQKQNLDNHQKILRTDSNEFKNEKMQTINQKPQKTMNLLNFIYINTSINNIHKKNNNDSNQMNQFKLWQMPNLRENIMSNYKTPKKNIFLKINDVKTIKPILSKNHKNKKLFLCKSPEHLKNLIINNNNDRGNNQSTSFKRFCDNLIEKKYDSKTQKSYNITSNDSNNNKLVNNYDEKVINSLNNEILTNKNSKSIEIKKINNHKNSLSIKKKQYASPWKNFQQTIIKKGIMTPSFDKIERKLIKTNVINTPKNETNLYYNNINININTINVNKERSNNFNENKLNNVFTERRKVLTLKHKEDNANFINSPNANSINVDIVKSPFLKNKNNKKINFTNLIAESKKKNTIYYYDNKRHTGIIAKSVGPHHKMKDGGIFMVKTGVMQRNFGNNNLSKNLNERKGNPKSEEKIKNNNTKKNSPFLNKDIYSNNIYNLKII